MASSPKEDGEIVGLAKQCAVLFTEVKELLLDRPGNQFIMALEYEQRFQHWAGDFGLFSEPQISMEARIRRQRGLRSAIFQLLELLEVNLGRVIYFESPSSNDQPNVASVQSWLLSTLGDFHPFSIFKAASRSTVLAAELAPASLACFDAIQDAIDQLNNLTMAIKASQTTPSTQAEETDDFGDDDAGDDTDDDDDDDVSPSSIARRQLKSGGLIASRFSGLDISLVKRLEASIEDRRQRLHRRRHRLRHAGPLDLLNAGFNVDTLTAEDSAASEDSSLQSDLYSRLEWYEIEQDNRYTRPSILNGDASTQLCQWCHQQIEVTSIQESTWRQHCLEDIQPYICLLPACNEPAPCFSSFGQWEEHMKSHNHEWVQELNSRPRWYCDECPLPSENFSSLTDLNDHIKAAHKEIPRVQIATMLENNMLILKGDPNLCPLCKATSGTSEEIARHTARHLRSLAWLSIQYLDDALPALSQADRDYTASFSDGEGPGESDDAQLGTLRDMDAMLAELPSVPGPEESSTGPDEGNPPELSNSGDSLDQIWREVAQGVVGTSEPGRPPMPENGHQPNPDPRPMPADLPASRGHTVPHPSSDPTKHNNTMTARTLARRIQELMVESPLDAKRFLPRSRIDEQITRANITQVLNSGSGPDIEESVIEFVLRDAKTFFAIMVTVRMDLRLAVKTLYHFGLTDKFLPIPEEAIEDSCEEDDGDRHCKHDKCLDAFHIEPWDHMTLSDFYDKQWRFLAPVFTTEEFKILHLSTYSIFPFIELSTHRKSSLFSDVYEVKIHRDHITPSYQRNARFAVKELRTHENIAREFNVWDSFEVETHALKEISTLNNEHIVPALATIERGEKRYLLFPWADGGNLREFWSETDICPVTPELIQGVLDQLLGLSEGLDSIHQLSWRHGDVKPENILRFKDDTILGILKLGDMGLAKKHKASTDERQHATKTRVGTLRYEPPESIMSNAPRSRRYDIWSMGCIMLEFIIWLQYGPKGLEEFNLGLNTSPDTSASFYSITKDSDGQSHAHLHEGVEWWLEQMKTDELLEEGTALGDLVRFIQAHMLVVQLPHLPLDRGFATAPDPKTSPFGILSIPSILEMVPRMATAGDSVSVRVDSGALVDALRDICSLSRKTKNYLIPTKLHMEGQRRRAPPQRQRLLLRADSRLASLDPSLALTIEKPIFGENMDEYRGLEFVRRISTPLPGHVAEELRTNTFQMQNGWNYIVDNDFAASFARSSDDILQLARQAEAVPLCERCNRLDFRPLGFTFSYEVSYLEKSTKSRQCALCALLYKASASSGVPMIGKLQFRRVGSVLKVLDSGPPILSVVAGLRSVGTSTGIPPGIQFGYTVLPEPLSSPSFQLMRHWIRTCDESHRCTAIQAEPDLPRRLLSTNYEVKGGVRLCPIDEIEPQMRYIALSYVWGKPTGKLTGLWRTTLANLAELQQVIDYDLLGQTLQDAIRVTHQLGIKYLWVDTFCIVQDSAYERLEDVMQIGKIFNNAYCVLVASSALDANEGFLRRPQQSRDIVPLTPVDNVPLSICELIDDFQKDVDASPHSSRGWAFQERVLARRAIYFTHTQMYWQCGDGIRCETLTKLHNLSADILGSPDFPKSALDKGISPTRIYKALYERYSRLQFTFLADRAIGITALEDKLLRAFSTNGGFGVLEKFLGQSLLWRREGGSLERIDFSGLETRAPSWSWMAYMGGISYFDIVMGSIEWADLGSPFQHGPDSGEPKYAIIAFAQQFHKKKIADIFYDLPMNADRSDQACVVIGTAKQNLKAFYLMIVAPRQGLTAAQGANWERIGIAFAEGDGAFLSDTEKMRIEIW